VSNQKPSEFAEQTSSDRVLAYALDAIDKPGLGDPVSSIRRDMERFGSAHVERALAKCRELLELNPHDEVALGAQRLLDEARTRA
jgi:hypothetical protein